MSSVKVSGIGYYQGREVEVSWEDGEFDSSDLEAGHAIVEKSTEWIGRTLVLASGERVRDDLLRHPAGFACVAGLVLEEFVSDYEPDPPLPEGFVT